MSEFADSLPCKFISFRHLSLESRADNLPEEREWEDSQNVAEIDEAKNVVVGETSTSQQKIHPVCRVHQ